MKTYFNTTKNQIAELIFEKHRYPTMDVDALFNLEQFSALYKCIDFLQTVGAGKKMNRQHTSYGYKHMVERYKQHDCYVYEGTFICAALFVGFKGEQIYPDSKELITTEFNIKESTLKPHKR